MNHAYVAKIRSETSCNADGLRHDPHCFGCCCCCYCCRCRWNRGGDQMRTRTPQVQWLRVMYCQCGGDGKRTEAFHCGMRMTYQCVGPFAFLVWYLFTTPRGRCERRTPPTSVGVLGAGGSVAWRGRSVERSVRGNLTESWRSLNGRPFLRTHHL